jgi:methionyl-tRNA synthetase
VTAEVLRQVAILCQPFMPESAGKLLDLLAIPVDRRSFADFRTRIAAGATLPAPSPVFPRYIEPATQAAQ